ncbi:MAG TPA: SufE family protein [Myxococcota bacterium]|nr:SufE family protein [Myxococcota bacterium]
MDLAELRDHFSVLDDQDERYRYLIDLGKRLRPMPPELKTAGTKVDGCLSQVWLHASATGSGDALRLELLADSDAVIVRGLIAILLIAYDGRHPAEVLKTDTRDLFDELGFSTPLSMNRRNGFFAMVQRIQSEARGALERHDAGGTLP